MPAKATVAVEIWTGDDGTETLFSAWCNVLATYKPKPGKTKLVPMTVDHPAMAMHGLSRFYVVRTGWKFIKDQTYEGRLELVEYFAQPKASGTQQPPIGASLPTVLPGQIPSTGSSFEGGASPPASPDTNNTGPT
jgi:hypothetical protein